MLPCLAPLRRDYCYNILTKHCLKYIVVKYFRIKDVGSVLFTRGLTLLQRDHNILLVVFRGNKYYGTDITCFR